MNRVNSAKNTGYGQIFDESFRRCPDREGHCIPGTWRISYRGLDRLINKAAHFLKAQGLRREIRCDHLHRCRGFLIVEFAMYRLGVVPVKFNWRLARRK